MGRKADPAFIRQLKGKKPHVPPSEAISFPSASSPLEIIPPTYLTRQAQHHWERMTLILQPIGLLQEVGRDKLARYCQACADYEEIMEERKKLGAKKLKVNMYNKDQYSHWIKLLQMASDEMKDFEREYGLTPASAAKLRRPNAGGPKTPQEKFKDFLDELPRANP